MSLIRRFLLRVLSSVNAGRGENDLAREIDSHLRLLEDQLVAGGMSADEARAAARRAFGGVEQMKEHQRDARTFRWLAGWPMDLRLGARMLVKSPGLTVVAVVALSIAIGGCAAYMEVLNGHYRATLRFEGADRLVGIQNRDVLLDQPVEKSLADFQAWRTGSRTLEHLGAYTPIERNLVTSDGRSEPVRGVAITASAFRAVPVTPLAGRPLVQDDESAGAADVAVIGDRLWRSRFAGDYGVVGRTVKLGSRTYTVVGVMPESFGFPVNHSLWIPLRDAASAPRRGEGPAIRVFGRLAPGASIQAAEAELAALSTRAPNGPGSPAQVRPDVRPYVESVAASSGDDAMQQTILYGLNVFFVGLLAICGANVGTLVFARTATREGEITVRTALGASRARIVTQLFAEALVLTSIATAVGLFGAAVALDSLNTWIESKGGQMPFWWDYRLGAWTYAYALLLTLLAAALIGVVPALKATGYEMQVRLKHAAGGGSSLSFGRFWTGIIVAQVAVTVIFLLTVVSLAWNASSAPYARLTFVFPAQAYLSAGLEMDEEEDGAAHASRFTAMYREIERRLESTPGVAGVSYATRLPGLGHDEFWVELDGVEPATRPADGPLWTRSAGVASDFFQTFDQSLLHGRGFTLAEVEQQQPVAIVDETFARLILGGRNPVGVRVRHNQDAKPGAWLEIVGVVRDAASHPGKITEDAVLYRPAAIGAGTPIQIVTRVNGDAAGWKQRVADAAAAAGPSVRLHELRTLAEGHAADRLAHGYLARGLAIVAAVALLLSTAGVYSLMSFTLARRRREIGIRAALGAAPRRIVTAIFSRAFRQVGLGVAAGALPGAALVAFGAPEVARGGGAAIALSATAAVGALIVCIALFACVAPARRALRVQPTEALRADG